MNDKNIEDLLKAGRPVVKDDPTFLMETRRRMEQVEGIKEEVDRQGKKSRIILVVTLVVGLVLGMLATAVIFLFPNLIQDFENSFLAPLRDFLFQWKEYLFFAVAALAVALGLVLGTDRKGSLLTR